MSITQIIKTTIAQKILVAITGIFMIFFLIGHLLGNLEIYSGPESYNQYAALLKSFPKGLWGARIFMLLAIGIHVFLTIRLNKNNQRAKPLKYEQPHFRKTTLASRTMLVSGVTILAFIVYHLLHFTLFVTNPEYSNLTDFEGRHDVFNMVVMGFSNPIISGFYIIAQIFLAFHVSHGVSSCVRTLGMTNPKRYEIVRSAGHVFAGIVAVLYISIPLSVLFGILQLHS